MRLDRGVEAPIPRGWQSLRYGEKTPTATVSMNLDGTLPRRVVTLVLLGLEGELEFNPEASALRATIIGGAKRVLRADLRPLGAPALPTFIRVAWDGREVAIPQSMQAGGVG
jgi:hypothetical protein